jgi:flagella basal body P-ring formation protein FlgA
MKSVSGLLLLLAAVLAVGMAAPCHAGSTRGEVFLEGDTITVGDVFEGMGEKSAKVIGPAPEPGQKFAYDVSSLMQIAKAFNLDWKPSGNYERVTVTRTSQKVNAAMVGSMVLEMLASMADNKDLDIALDNQGLEINRPLHLKMDYQISDLKYDAISHRFNGKLVVTTEGMAAEVTPVTGRAMPMTQVARLVESINGGTVLADSDIEWVRVPLDKAGADIISNARQLEGLELRRAMNAQSLLRQRDFVKARLITKGSLVVMQAKTANMALTAQGRALSDGAIGDTIRVTNTQSNRTLDAVVIGKDRVSVLVNTAPQVAAR